MRRLAALVSLAVCLNGCVASPAPGSPSPAPVASVLPLTDPLEKAARFLLKARSPDGGWHSSKYRDMAEGPELTPFVLKALTYSRAELETREPAIAYLKAQKPEKGKLIYPVYTSSGILLDRLDEKGLWKGFLLDFQADEHLGWSRGDLSYGGWSYSMEPPRKPRGEVPTLSQANLPSTLFALGGLSLSQGGLDRATADKALVFLQRCQNFPDGDGGFCASPTDPSMNKAGGHVSYGSATSDGLRGLLRCGLKVDRPRVLAARSWVERHLSSTVHPGEFPEGRFEDRDSLFYYYCWSTAHALAALQRSGAELTAKEKAWQTEVHQAILKRQREDGSWVNPAGATREDDPLVATPMAMAVLVLTSSAPDAQATPGR